MTIVRKKILLFHPGMSSFIKKDIEILQSQHLVVVHEFKPNPKWRTPFSFLLQLIFLLREVWTADVMLCEFAAYHSIMPAWFGLLLRKPCYVIIGGMEGHSFPRLHYGNSTKLLLGQFTGWSLRLCSRILPKHFSLIEHEYYYSPEGSIRQGVHYLYNRVRTPWTVIENGYDADRWQRVAEKHPRTFCTVAHGWDFSFQYALKGIDLLEAAAEKFPDCKFTIVGMKDKSLLKKQLPNVHTVEAIANAELPKFLSTQQFYLQLSLAEGFPNALCEAMLCECVPIGSNVFSIPEIIGDSGFVLTEHDEALLFALVQAALMSDAKVLGTRARKRITDHYLLQQRADKLLAVIG